MSIYLSIYLHIYLSIYLYIQTYMYIHLCFYINIYIRDLSSWSHREGWWMAKAPGRAASGRPLDPSLAKWIGIGSETGSYARCIDVCIIQR